MTELVQPASPYSSLPETSSSSVTASTSSGVAVGRSKNILKDVVEVHAQQVINNAQIVASELAGKVEEAKKVVESHLDHISKEVNAKKEIISVELEKRATELQQRAKHVRKALKRVFNPRAIRTLEESIKQSNEVLLVFRKRRPIAAYELVQNITIGSQEPLATHHATLFVFHDPQVRQEGQAASVVKRGGRSKANSTGSNTQLCCVICDVNTDSPYHQVLRGPSFFEEFGIRFRNPLGTPTEVIALTMSRVPRKVTDLKGARQAWHRALDCFDLLSGKFPYGLSSPNCEDFVEYVLTGCPNRSVQVQRVNNRAFAVFVFATLFALISLNVYYFSGSAAAARDSVLAQLKWYVRYPATLIPWVTFQIISGFPGNLIRLGKISLPVMKLVLQIVFLVAAICVTFLYVGGLLCMVLLVVLLLLELAVWFGVWIERKQMSPLMFVVCSFCLRHRHDGLLKHIHTTYRGIANEKAAWEIYQNELCVMYDIKPALRFRPTYREIAAQAISKDKGD